VDNSTFGDGASTQTLSLYCVTSVVPEARGFASQREHNLTDGFCACLLVEIAVNDPTSADYKSEAYFCMPISDIMLSDDYGYVAVCGPP